MLLIEVVNNPLSRSFLPDYHGAHIFSLSSAASLLVSYDGFSAGHHKVPFCGDDLHIS